LVEVFEKKSGDDMSYILQVVHFKIEIANIICFHFVGKEEPEEHNVYHLTNMYKTGRSTKNNEASTIYFLSM
jgi:hypothetical protein